MEGYFAGFDMPGRLGFAYIKKTSLVLGLSTNLVGRSHTSTLASAFETSWIVPDYSCSDLACSLTASHNGTDREVRQA